MIRPLVPALILACTTPLAAQVVAVTVQPPAPTTQSRVLIVVDAFYPCEPVTMTRTGNAIRIDVPLQCVVVLPMTVRTNFDSGFLPAGTYTYEVYAGSSLDRSGTFVVAEAGAPFIPSLSFVAQCLLAAALGILGVIYLRRFS